MGLRRLEIIISFDTGIDFIRQNVYKRQILTSKDDPRAVNVNPALVPCLLGMSMWLILSCVDRSLPP